MKTLTSPLESFIGFGYFLWSNLPWIIWRQHNDLVLNSTKWNVEKDHEANGTLNDYGRFEEQRMLKDLAEALDVAIDTVSYCH